MIFLLLILNFCTFKEVVKWEYPYIKKYIAYIFVKHVASRLPYQVSIFYFSTISSLCYCLGINKTAIIFILCNWLFHLRNYLKRVLFSYSSNTRPRSSIWYLQCSDGSPFEQGMEPLWAKRHNLLAKQHLHSSVYKEIKMSITWYMELIVILLFLVSKTKLTELQYLAELSPFLVSPWLL